MLLVSPNFDSNGAIPSDYTCDGSDTSPELRWFEAPEGTKSFALSCIDPDSPGGNFVHWLIYGIGADVTTIDAGEIPDGTIELENDFGNPGYGGPCPGTGTHRYFFSLYALDTDNLGEVSPDNFLEKIEEATLEKAVLMGTYERI